MLAQRIAQQSLRRLAVQQPAYKLLLPTTSIAARNAFTTSQVRPAAATQSMSEGQASDQILAKQRLHRPVSPHLSVYKPQITWVLSSLNRITGVALSGGFYLFGMAYLIAPYAGFHLESQVLAAGFAAWPVVLKVFAKALVALPFTFHSFNGLRHLMWDTASGISNSQVQKTGWTVVGVGVLTALGLAFV